MPATHQEPSPWIGYQIMKFIMTVLKMTRNLSGEIILADPKPTDTVVDFGCGPGFNTIPLARDVVTQGKVYALDNSPDAIRDIHNLAIKNGIANIETIEGCYPEMINDASVDVVYLHNVLPFIKHRDDALSEIYRILKPGGRLSYISKRISRRVGRRSTGVRPYSNRRLREILEADGKYVLRNRERNHMVFEKQ